jgi:hypothetical protein
MTKRQCILGAMLSLIRNTVRSFCAWEEGAGMVISQKYPVDITKRQQSKLAPPL